MYSLKYNQQDATLYNITVNALHVLGGFLPIIRSSKTAHTASGMCQACFLLLLAWVSRNYSPTLVVAANKLGTYPMLYVQFLSPWWWAEWVGE